MFSVNVTEFRAIKNGPLIVGLIYCNKHYCVVFRYTVTVLNVLPLKPGGGTTQLGNLQRVSSVVKKNRHFSQLIKTYYKYKTYISCTYFLLLIDLVKLSYLNLKK